MKNSHYPVILVVVMKKLMKQISYILLITILSASSPILAQIQSSEEIASKRAYIKALEAHESEEYEQAKELLLEVNRTLEGEPAVHYALADAFLMLQDLPNAAMYGKQAVELEPENKWYRLKLAQVYRSAGQNQATLDELNALLEYHPNDIDALYMLADTYKDYGQFVRSNEILTQILKIGGPDPSVLLLKFRNFESLGSQDSAIVQLEKIREQDPGNLEMLNLLGEYYGRTGEIQKSKIILREALERNARDPQSLINLAGIYLDEQKWDSAGTLLRNFISDSLIEANQKMDIAQFLFSRAQENTTNEELQTETGKILEAFAESESNYGPAYTLTGEFFARNNQPEKALKSLEKANEILPQDDLAWRQRLQLLLSLERYEEAIEVGKQADQSIPDDAFVQFFVGSAYMLSDQNGEAEQWLENASRAPARRPFKSVVYSTLGDVRANLENHSDSDEAYELALRYDSENHNAMNNYAYNLSVREIELDRAEELALKAIELAPENAAYLDTIGWVYYKKGDYEQARRYIRASIDTGEASAEVFEHMGDVYEQLDNMTEAQKWWKQALDLDPERTHLQQKIN